MSATRRTRRGRQVGEMNFGKPWLTSVEAASYIGYRGTHALRTLYRYIQNNGIKVARRGRFLLVSRASLDRSIGATSG